MTNINSDALSDLTWASRLGASSPRTVSFPGTSVPVAVIGTVPCATVAHAVPRVRAQAWIAVPPMQKDAVSALLGQTNTDNYMTRAYATGEGASGPPPREPV